MSSSSTTPLGAVIVAAGSSKRMGFDKLLTPIAGEPLLSHTLKAVTQCPSITSIVVVIRPETQNTIHSILSTIQSPTPILLTHGGAERQDSVRLGITALPPDYPYVLIHDAARPFIDENLVQKVLQAAITCGAAVCGHPSRDTLKEINPDQPPITIHRTLDRSRIWAVQTPQIFYRPLIEKAYDFVHRNNLHVTDDTAAVELLGHPVQIVSHDRCNLKITTPDDWRLAELLLSS
ncbi:MAG: 2-C-methyl-D-erythritol 4-phosphate cytidylyltransferase [Methylacidiphilales bacterium]|nr:2-C-methyl-D-erythritol 4-phosphate cytidylyltransferase [Candidatus Methylacidiphilales bacterium]MDW8349484.1 2-C-methyl-D-erythritol 4-phosphate cytidylyltransferase [Verrucomicrobiae bacterium]